MDFFQVREKNTKYGVELYPDFKVCRSKDLMVRGKGFYAIWDEETQLWSTDEYDVQRLVDKELAEKYEKLMASSDGRVSVKYMGSYSSNTWKDFRSYVANISDNSHQLDTKVTFSNTETKKTDYISRRLSYPLEKGTYEAYDEIMSTLYSPEERKKLEWAIGAIIAGEAKHIQKFIVLYGAAGAGKSTVLNIIQKLFDGYYTTFEAKALTSTSNAFSTEVFRNNPLVAVQHDGDLSRIEDNTKLNSIVSHEEIIINEKYKSGYSMRVNCFLFMATNKPVKITDAKSGLIRRLIDVSPTGEKIPIRRYNSLMNQIDFELGAIASHCLDIFNEMGKNYYNTYRPVEMMYKTDPFYNFVEECYDIFEEQDGVTLKQAYAMYKEYCDQTNADYKLQMYRFREELKNYFKEFYERVELDGTFYRNYYQGFLYKKFKRDAEPEMDIPSGFRLEFRCTKSIFDDDCAGYLAQEATDDGHPRKRWMNCKTTLADIDTHKLHFVKMPVNHIVIDFDLKDEKGEKSYSKNVEAASKWPPTYAELSKSGSGIHLHYIYDGDVSKLKNVYDDDIEVKVFNGNSSLRRKLTRCNNLPIATINSGLPLKEKGSDRMINATTIKSEKGLRALIEKNLLKQIHPGTKPSIDFIVKILDDAYDNGLKYDISDLRPDILSFAAGSTNHAEYCIKQVNKMKFKSDEPSNPVPYKSDIIIFYDVEVFPNLFLVNWKHAGKNKSVVRMINPSPKEIEELLQYKLVGFNNRRYDNHMLYARLMGYSNEQLYEQSQRIIKQQSGAFFGEAYNISYTDIYDFSSKKQSLKKFEIELGLHHKELGLPWDQPVPEELWNKVAEYCDNDVIATEAVFNARQQDFVARQILADLSGLTVNDTTRMHATKIIFGGEKHPDLVYTDLSEMFPGYSFDAGHSNYRDEDPGEGGYVYSEPGCYCDVALLDIASMHPTSIIELNLFGSYTKKFEDILKARLLIKHKEFDKAKKILNGALAPYLENEDQASDLAQALKIVINSVYGYTTATFDNPFKDPRNIDNIVAKRGSLFMINLKHEVQERGFKVVHIKTDSIKIPNATPEIIKFVMDYGKKYGYSFEHEATYDRMCLVNDAVYIAMYKDGNHEYKLSTGEKLNTPWTATGTQFQIPFIFKSLFSKHELRFEDFCETKSVSAGDLYLDMNEGLPEGEHNYVFVGRVGSFCPIKDGCGGGVLYRMKDGKYYAAAGTKGYRWLEAETVKNLGKEQEVNEAYYETLAEEAIKAIENFGSFELFVDTSVPYSELIPPFD